MTMSMGGMTMVRSGRGGREGREDGEGGREGLGDVIATSNSDHTKMLVIFQ